MCKAGLGNTVNCFTVNNVNTEISVMSDFKFNNYKFPLKNSPNHKRMEVIKCYKVTSEDRRSVLYPKCYTENLTSQGASMETPSNISFLMHSQLSCKNDRDLQFGKGFLDTALKA